MGIVDKLVRAAECKSDSAFARLVPVRVQSVQKWRRRGYVPLTRVSRVAAITGLPMYEVRPDRPDLFPPPRGRDA